MRSTWVRRALRRQEQLQPVADQGGAHPVLVAQGGEGEEGGDLRRQLALEDRPRAEGQAARDVDHQEDR